MSEAFQNFEHVHLTAKDFQHCRENLSGIVIAPYDPINAKGVGYNFSLSEMVYSITRNRLVSIHRDIHETFFYLRPQETVLALSYEYLKVDQQTAGSFHSRVRMTAKGVGSISTTLDPGWKGMLLFSLNNPTSKRIKIIISTQVDGVVKRQPVLTLVAWRTTEAISESKAGTHIENLSLHLDNPPMRIDIWSELTAKPLRLFRNREYQKFINLVNKLSPFSPNSSHIAGWCEQLNRLLTELQIAVSVSRNEEEIRSVLTRIKNFGEIPVSLKKHLDNLTAKLKELQIRESCASEEYIAVIDLTRREIQYLLLCEQISQIHEMIANQVPVVWHKTFLATLWHVFLNNIGVFLSTLYFVFLISFGFFLSEIDFWKQMVIAFIPLIISFACHAIMERK